MHLYDRVSLISFYNEKYFRQNCRENQNIYIFSITFFNNRESYEIMRKNTAEPDRPQMIIWRMRIACWVPKATNIHSECVLVIAFRLQQWLHEGSSMLRYTYIACPRCYMKCTLHVRGGGLDMTASALR